MNRVARCLLFAGVSVAFASSGAARADRPWVGAPALQRTTAEIMAEQARTPEHPLRVVPKRHYPDRRHLPQNPASPPVSQLPPAPPEPLRREAAASFTAQTVGTTFTGATLADAGYFPPDSMGAVGPSQYVVFVNGRIRSFAKATGLPDGVLDVTPDVFFASVMTPLGGVVASNYTSDPRIRYDRLTGRWFLLIIDVPLDNAVPPNTVAENRLLFAVSNGPTLSGATTWSFFQFRHDQVSPTGDTGDFADYPTLGIDANALYVGVNVFTLAGAWVGTTGFVVRKSSLTGGGPIVATAFRGLAVGSGSGPATPQGVDNLDPAATEGYFIGVDNALFGTLQLRRVSDPGGTPTISDNVTITVPTTYWPLNVPHLGNTGSELDGLDDRLFAAHLRGGRLWTAHNIQVNRSGVASNGGGRDAVRWYELQGIATGSTPGIVESGTIYDGASTNPKFYWIPSVMVSGQGHAAFGFSSAGATAYANAATVGRFAGDPLGTVQAPVFNYTNGTTSYNPPGDSPAQGPRRWGDYSYTSLDPIDDMTMWTIQEFCSSTDSWGVRVAKLIAPPPATPLGSATLLGTTANQVVNVTATSVAGSGFYDPGANPSGGVAFNHLAASVNPSTGVTVNGVAYVDPTHLTLNITTTGAITGSRDLVITNPDGQSITAVGYFQPSGPAMATVSGNATICAGQSTQIQAALAGTSPWSLTWSDGVVQSGVTISPAVRTVSPAASTDYTVTAVSDAGGSGTAAGSAAVIVQPAPATPVISVAASVGAGSPGRTASVTDNPGSTYQWNVTNGTITAGQGTAQITFTAGSAGTLGLSVVETNSSSCVSAAGTANVSVLDPWSAVLFYTALPCRIFDTRDPVGPRGGPSFTAGQTRTFAVSGVCGIPAAARAISVNVTVTNPAAAGSLTLFRGDIAMPLASTINFIPGLTRANNAVIQLSNDGATSFKVHNGSNGTTDVLVDVNGWFE